MTDNPKDSLNLVERIAKRMAAEAVQGISAQPVTPSFAERVVQKVAPKAPLPAPATLAANGNGLAQNQFPEAPATVAHARGGTTASH